MTAEHLINQTSTETIPSASFDPTWLLFKYAVLAIGIFGTAANALVLYALTVYNAREAKKRAINLLIINQNLLDLFCCLLLVTSVSIQISNSYLTGAIGYFICITFVHDTASYCALYASVINLVTITIERYLKVVHPFWSKKYLKRWMAQAGMAFSWIAGVVSGAPVPVIVFHLEDGVCMPYFAAQEWKIASCCNVTIYVLLPLIVFVYCYGRMAVVMRRQMRVMAGYSVEGSSQINASQVQSKRVKWNIIKTMIVVSVAFVVSWFPNSILYISETFSLIDVSTAGYTATVFLMYLNVCMNPFIYATKQDGVKHQLGRLIHCRKPRDVGAPAGNRRDGLEHISLPHTATEPE